MNPKYLVEAEYGAFMYVSFFMMIIWYCFTLSEYTFFLSLLMVYILAFYVTMKALRNQDTLRNQIPQDRNVYRYNVAIADLYD